MNINKINVLKLSLKLTQVNIPVELALLSQPGALSNTLFQFILHMQLLTFYCSFYPLKAPLF